MDFNNLKISFFLASKSIIKGNKSTIALTIMIMALAYINLVFTSSILMGILKTMDMQAINNQLGNIVIEPEEDETYIKQVDSLQKKIDSIPGVMGSSAHYIVGAVFSFDKDKDGNNIKTGNYTLKSIEPEEEAKTTNISLKMAAGEFLQDTDRDKIILGREVSGKYESNFESQALGADIGDEITLNFKNGVERKYEIKGIFATKNMDTDIMAFVTKKEMESILGLNNYASEIIVKTEDIGKEEKYISEMKRLGITKEEIKPWQDYMGMSKGLSESFGTIRLVISIIGLIVASITIFIVIFISVVNKKKQIGILKAIGMEEEIIVKSYILQALFYALTGVGAGLVITYFLIIPYFIDNPLSFPMGPVSLAATTNDLAINSLSLVAAELIAGFIPSWRAAREDIVKSIWGTH